MCVCVCVCVCVSVCVCVCVWYMCVHTRAHVKHLPNNAPIARLISFCFEFFIAANELKMSGAPLPIAKNVTPYN